MYQVTHYVNDEDKDYAAREFRKWENWSRKRRGLPPLPEIKEVNKWNITFINTQCYRCGCELKRSKSAMRQAEAMGRPGVYCGPCIARMRIEGLERKRAR